MAQPILKRLINSKLPSRETKQPGEIVNYVSTLLETMSEICCIYDADGYLTYVNPQALGITGCSTEEMLGRNLLDFAPPESYPAWIEQIEARIQKGQPGSHEKYIVDKAGRVHWFRVNALPIIENNMIYGALVVAQDISEQRQLEEILRVTQQKYSKAEQLASWGALAAGVAHEITQPINALKLFTGTVLYHLKHGKSLSREEIILYLSDIAQEVDRLEEIITHIRSLAQTDNHTPTSGCDLNQLIRNVLNLLERQLSSHGIKLKTSLGRDLPVVRAHPQRLEIAIINLIVNAMQALDLTDRSEKIIRLSTTAGSDMAIMQISDNGIGIAPEELNHIFEPFYTTKKTSVNMGLGLSIVKTIVTSLGGEVQCWNEESSGVTFQVLIPLLI